MESFGTNAPLSPPNVSRPGAESCSSLLPERPDVTARACPTLAATSSVRSRGHPRLLRCSTSNHTLRRVCRRVFRQRAVQREVLQQSLQTDCLKRVECAPEATTIDRVSTIAVFVPQPCCQLCLVSDLRKVPVCLQGYAQELAHNIMCVCQPLCSRRLCMAARPLNHWRLLESNSVADA